MCSLLGAIAEYNSNYAQKWEQICWKSVQLDRVAFFRRDFFQNWYFSENYIYLFEQFISGLFLVKSNKAKVFGFAVLAKVNRPLDFNNLTVLDEMLENYISRDGGVFELANVNLALFGCGLKFEKKTCMGLKVAFFFRKSDEIFSDLQI